MSFDALGELTGFRVGTVGSAGSSVPKRAWAERVCSWAAAPRPVMLATAFALSGTGDAATLVTHNGGFGSGGAGWNLVGGAEVVATGEPDDDPYARVPDGGVVFLYQKLRTPAPAFTVSFDFHTGLMTTGFPSPGGFPDTAFGTLYTGATDAGLAPEEFKSDGAIALLEYDAVNGLRGIPLRATVSASGLRPGWTRFEGWLAAIPGQPFLALTFQTVDGNGVRGDSALLVDNVFLAAVPEAASGPMAAAGCVLAALWRLCGRRKKSGLAHCRAVCEVGTTLALPPTLSHPIGEGARLVHRSPSGEGGRAGEVRSVAHPADQPVEGAGAGLPAS